MGVHDFVSVVQRNGQNICGLAFTGATRFAVDGALSSGDESDSEWASACDDGPISDAVLVRVPRAHARTEIAAWPLARFAEFGSLTATYCWDSWAFDFEEGREYYEQLCDGGAAEGVWASALHPGVRLVCFLAAEYEAFVAGSVSPDTIPRANYARVFEERGALLPETKLEAFAATARGFGGEPGA